MEPIKFGIMGLGRGCSFIGSIAQNPDAVLWAICDKDQSKVDSTFANNPIDTKGALGFTDFYEFIESGVQAVVLANYFNEHAKFAMECFKRGIHVLSECTTAPTLKECVEMCEAVEETGCKYMIAENYPFTAANMEMEYICQEGTLGRILYAEGEYNHTGTKDVLASLTPGKYHWRGWMPRTYYNTHSLGPLMYATKQYPVSVSSFAVHSDVLLGYDDFRHNTDAFSMMTCMTDGGAMFRFTGCAHIGSHSGYRICGEYGGIETGRSLGGNVQLIYHSFSTPEGKESSQTYAPTWRTNAELAAQAGHGGGDFWTVYNFVEYLKTGEEPFFNVYAGATMSAVAILGWRSCLENGKTYAIPNFRDKADREKYKNDDLTPFPDENGNGATLPPSIYHAKKDGFVLQNKF